MSEPRRPLSEHPLAHVAVRSAFELVELVEGLPDTATGELVVEDASKQAAGVIFVERGRVCWAAARGLARRLSDLLRDRTSPRLGRVEMEMLYLRCRRDGVPLGELLVKEGLLAPHDLKDALRRHSVESILVLGASPATARWNARKGPGFNAAFTFEGAELAVAMGPLATEQDPEPHDALLADIGAEWGAAWIRSPKYSHPVAIAVRGSVSTSAADLASIGRWATNLVDISGFEEPSRLVALTTSAKGGVFAWARGDVVYAACMADSARFARTMIRLAAPSAPRSG